MLKSPTNDVNYGSLKNCESWCEIKGTTGYRGDVNVINVDGDIVDLGCDNKLSSFMDLP